LGLKIPVGEKRLFKRKKRLDDLSNPFGVRLWGDTSKGVPGEKGDPSGSRQGGSGR